MERWGHAVKHLWPLEENMAFLNHGSYGACPRRVLAAQAQWRDRLEAQPCQFISHEVPVELRKTAAAIAGFTGAEAKDVVLVENTTGGINAVLKSLRFEQGDRIVAIDHIYNAIKNTLNFVLKPVGAKLDLVPLGLPVMSEDAIIEAIDAALQKPARLLVIDHVASVSAVKFPVQRIAALARSHGIPVLVDAAHAPGMLELDIPALGADWYVGNCHKWLCAPKGAAFLWAREEHQEDLHPTVISHDLGKGYTFEFDKIGTRDFSSWLAVTEAIAFHRELGGTELRQRNHDVAIQGMELLIEAWKTEGGAPPNLFGSMATVRIPGNSPVTREEADRLKRELWQNNRIEAHVMPFDGALWTRISIQAYNELADVEELAAAMPACVSR